MLHNYIKIALRNLWKNKGFSLINIIGLAVGISICLLIVVYIQSELGYDRFNEKADRIYRMVLERRYPGRSTSYSIIPHSIGEAVQKEYSEVQQCMRMYADGGNTIFIRIGNQVFEENHVIFADSNFFQVFTIPLTQGNPQTALNKPNAVVLTEETALKYFGTLNVLNKTIKLDAGGNDLIVTGVCSKVPENSHFTFNLLAASSGIDFTKQINYTGFDAYTYFLLQPNASAKSLEAKFPKIIEKYVAGEIARTFDTSYEQFQAAGNGYNYSLQPLLDIHLHSDLEAELKPNGSISTIYIFSVIAGFILLIACVNFVNLATARSVERAKEVGIRKTFGSERKMLVMQFLTEAVVISVFSFTTSCLLLLILLPFFNKISGKELSLGFLLNPVFMPGFLLFSVLIGLLAGGYPALILSSFQPLAVLRGKFKHNQKGIELRNGLVIFQFSISIILIICTIVVFKQMQFMQGDRLGFQKDHIITLQRTDLLTTKTKAFKTELKKIAGVEEVSGASSMPGGQNFFGMTMKAEGVKEPLTGRGLVVDNDFASTLKLEIVKGRSFSDKFPSDSLAVMLNEKAVAELGLANPIGARLTSPDPFLNQPGKPGQTYYTVVGILKDFHFQSLHQKITPLILLNTSKFGEVSPLTSLRIQSDKFQHTLTTIESLWHQFLPQQPFHYSFLDQDLAALYHAEQTSQRVFGVFSILAIFIACMGLLGLAAYTTQQRTKEIGVRKVLGASVQQIIVLLSRDFIRLVGISFVLASPIAWWVMSRWLENFAYRTGLSWWIFVVAGIAATGIALLTISYQAVKAALTNPVKALRTE
ncbi:ABC transporter permease [Xanthocytophaga flava]|uniref:ABC transporter permease n=1 Tax=Xanthocytophaga flava TaxID=3048013 RepID=UPI0028D1831D|nr:ABC transporter permease [Xanthocytophaga flavus]MDJ1467863.1 ABC transporter permease [Xanthocytophaga flavus]